LHQLLSLLIGLFLTLTSAPPDTLGLRAADGLVAVCSAGELCATVYSVRATLYARAFDYAAALQDIDQALKYHPQNAGLHVKRGQINLLLYEWDEVLRDYENALKIAPDYMEAYYYRGLLYYTWLRRDEAQRDFERVLLLAPRSGKAAEVRRYLQALDAERSALND
jgi:tetratricopeptide (TPR) repeat protein